MAGGAGVAARFAASSVVTAVGAEYTPHMSSDPGTEPQWSAASVAAAIVPPRSAELDARLAAALAQKGAGYRPRTHHLGPDGRPVYTNRLILESSPYLLQHAHNPVDWYPWGDEAFAEARRLQRPVFLSIGYSTCHWCHVMEGESFEDEKVAAFLNHNFIAIKVDREERPDVDAVYMAAVQALTGSGGWPMSVFLDADRAPFYAGTYFPPYDGVRGARLGFRSLLEQLARTYADEPERIGKASAALVEAVKEQIEGAVTAKGPPTVDRSPIALALNAYGRLFDPVHGGLRRAPKFPSNIPVRLLLREWTRTGDPALLQMITLTLEKMAAGGMYDQIGGGFHRYSTDAEWLVPHFEKMLYDNALLLVGYAEAYQATHRPDFARVVRETCTYLMREMTAPEGGFYSATDADSEGEEGKFFVWSLAEIEALLGHREAARFAQYYGITVAGNFEGHNIPHVPRPNEAEHAALGEARRKLYEARAQRPAPLLDDKILAAWNGLAISGFAVAGRILEEPAYLAAARRAADFVLTRMKRGDRIVRSYKDGKAAGVGFLEDQAFVVQGLIDLWESTFEERWLREAVALAAATEAHFADPERGGWFMTAADGEALIAREKPQYDGAEPSGTSVAWMNALRLATLTDDERWRKVAVSAYGSVAPLLANNPLALSEGLLALEFMTGGPREIVVTWPAGATIEAARPLLSVLATSFVPARVLAGAAEGEGPHDLVPLLAQRPALHGSATAYVCTAGHCDLPVTTPAALRDRLRPPATGKAS
jgi:uncharacterized protein